MCFRKEIKNDLIRVKQIGEILKERKKENLS
jgi:hypothetical protein